jgi:4-hydroxybenzoate polyprenyltransferase
VQDVRQTVTSVSGRSTLAGIVAVMRPRQWIKNGFVLAPVLFTGQFLNPQAIGDVALAFVLFCLGASAVYTLNDLNDVEDDRRHPAKAASRPIASGALSPRAAWLLIAAIVGALALALPLAPKVVLVVVAYLVLNAAYTLWLKTEPVVDLFCIAIGFVLRVQAGALAIGVPVSAWMFVTTLCLALYLAAVKRRQELLLSGAEARRVLRAYSVALVERYAEMSATAALLFYGMFVMSTRPELVVTIPVVMFCLFRYWFVVEAEGAGESPTDVLLADWKLLVGIVAWTAACIWALWPAA